MNRSLLVSPPSVALVVVMMVFAGVSILSIDEAAQFDQMASFSTDQSLSRETRDEATCDSPDETSLDCEEREQTILSTTLRIEIRTWIIYVEGQGYSSLFSNGHGTVMDGRNLLTHNHFQLPLLELLADDFNGEFATITLYTANGNVLWQGPLTTAAVAFDDSETLILEFLDGNGQGLFESFGIPSADFAAGGMPPVTLGATVAQINWDNDQAYVQWTQVEDVFSEAGTPVLQLANCIIGGSSGGGVFYNGEHIANNWSRSRGCVEENDDESKRFSRAALNSAEFLAAGYFRPGQE